MFLKNLLLPITMCFIVQMALAQGTATFPAQITDGQVVLSVNNLASSNYSHLTAEDFIEMDSITMDSFLQSQTSELRLQLEIDDDTDVDKIRVKVGRSAANFDVLVTDLNYDGSNFPTGMDMLKEGLEVYVELGSYTNLSSYYVEIYLIDPQGNLSNPYTKSN